MQIAGSNQRKHLFKWVKSFLNPHYLFDTKSPWLTFDAVDYIKKNVVFGGMKVFEYGSGGSTLFWISNGARVISVEHDIQFYNFIKEKVHHLMDYRLAPPGVDDNSNHDPSDPETYYSGDADYLMHEFYKYVTQIDMFPDDYFDVILIDGRVRPACIKHSVNKVKVGGYIILDNAGREHYTAKTGKYLNNFLKMEFCGATALGSGFGKTFIYKRLT
jgi:hypothetical protein